MMNKLFIYFLFILLFLTTCDLLDDSPCGPSLTYDLYLLGSGAFDTVGGQFNNYMEGNNRVFQWGNLVDHVCTDEHVKTEFKAALLDPELSPDIQARGRVSWQFLFEKTFPLQVNKLDLKGNGEIGLKNAFPDLNGWFIPTIEVFFPSKGSYSSDTAYLKQYLISIEIMSKYREYK